MQSKNMQKLVGIISGILGVLGLFAIVNSGNHVAPAQWLIEGFENLVFSIGWLSPFPNFVVYLIAILLIALVALIFYKLGTWLYRKVATAA